MARPDTTSELKGRFAAFTAFQTSRETVELRDELNDLETSEAIPHTSDMSTAISREELDAKLAANAAEVKAVASDMRAEMAGLRADNQTQFSSLHADMAGIRALIEGLGPRFDSIGARMDGLNSKMDGVEKGVEGKIDGLKSSIGMLQWVIGIVAAIAGLWVAYMQLKQAETPPAPPAVSAPATQPIIINVPAAPPTQPTK